jgi:hypothetical protein
MRSQVCNSQNLFRRLKLFTVRPSATLALLVIFLTLSLSACRTTGVPRGIGATSTASVDLSKPTSSEPTATPTLTLPSKTPTQEPDGTLISAQPTKSPATPTRPGRCCRQSEESIATPSTLSSENSTSMPTPEGTPTPTETSDPAASPTPDRVATGDNLLVNPYFGQGFSGWNLVNDFWSESVKKCTPSPNEMAVQIDRDGRNLWQGGEEDWLWQDVQASMPHTQVVFSLYEVHHMVNGLAETSLYGSDDGVNWELVWFRPEPDAEYGSGKPNCVAPWPTFTYTIDVGSGYNYYRLEFHFLASNPNDGWKFTSLDLRLVP